MYVTYPAGKELTGSVCRQEAKVEGKVIEQTFGLSHSSKPIIFGTTSLSGSSLPIGVTGDIYRK